MKKYCKNCKNSVKIKLLDPYAGNTFNKYFHGGYYQEPCELRNSFNDCCMYIPRWWRVWEWLD